MKMSNMYMPTLREVPSEAVIVSHQLLLRAAMIRKLANGLYAYLPLGLRVFQNIEAIIREELDNIGCLECKPTVIVPGELWKESGRWDTMGEGLLRFQNRLGQDLVASPTAEEAITDLVRHELTSYKQYPLSIYQINTKYRDEIRPRYGLMRTREFTMKDAYSFHTSAESLNESYQEFRTAYNKIFQRCALKPLIVGADTGVIGGKASEEFMVESTIGDDTLLLCPSCGYAANVEKAACQAEQKIEDLAAKDIPEYRAVDTPNAKTIEQVAAFFKVSEKEFIKSLVYAIEGKNRLAERLIMVCIRGDLEVNETKLLSFVGATELRLASNAEVEAVTGAPLGFAGPVGIKNIKVIADESVMAMAEGICGALKKDSHLAHVVPKRDFTPDHVCDIRTVKAGDSCIGCGTALYTKKGNELGHVFKLGDKYTRSMNMSYLDENGVQQHPLMGCYGIGVDRLLASIIEEHHDQNGIIWPMSVAPYTVAIIPIKYDGEMKRVANELYANLKKTGIAVLLDDRSERTGVKFKDMDLIGIPLHLIVGNKNLPNIEVKIRASQDATMIAQDAILESVQNIISDELQKLKEISRISYEK